RWPRRRQPLRHGTRVRGRRIARPDPEDFATPARYERLNRGRVARSTPMGKESQMVRKHARRAVKAAFAVALAIPIVLGGTANAGTTASPTITVGTKNFTEAFVLGQLYFQALKAKGFKVAYKENIGSSELIDTALKSGKINFYPEYTGVLALNIAHVKTPLKTAAATYVAAKA